MNFEELCKAKELSDKDIRTIVEGAIAKDIVFNVPDKFKEDADKINGRKDSFFLEKLLTEYYEDEDEMARAKILEIMFWFLYRRYC